MKDSALGAAKAAPVFFSGNSDQIACGWMAVLLPHPCSYENGKYIQYSSIFITFG